jgi:F-type H+-transporting ATPase subunit delta
MSEAITIARPYAQAAFEEAQKLADLKGWSETLVSLAETICHPEVSSVITSPRVAQAQLESLMNALMGNQATTQQRNFVRILVDNQRLLLLPEIVALFEALRAEAEKTVNALVESAF